MSSDIENFLSSHPYAKSTKENYRRVLHELVLTADLGQLDATGLIEFLDQPGWGNSQQNVALFCSKKFLKWKYGSLHPALAARIPYIKPKPRRSLDPNQALRLLACFNPYEPSGARGLAIVAFGLDTGFRREELCSMQLADVNFYTNTAAAICKGGQWGYGIFSDETAHLLRQWLHFRKPADGVGNLFISMKSGKALTGSGMSCIFKRLSKVIGFPISAHDLRASFATLSTINGMPSRMGQKAGRWASVEMFEHYTGNLQLDAARPFLPMANLKKPNT